MDSGKLKKWELALVLSLCVTLCHGFAIGAPTVNWWGVIFPGLTETAYREDVETVKLEGGQSGNIQLRSQLLEWLEALF